MLRFVVIGPAVIAALLFVVASAGLNYLFWSGQGRGEHEGLVLGLVSVGTDIFKAVLPILIAAAFAARRWGYVFLASSAFVVFLLAGLIAAVGFVANNRGDLIGGRESRNAQLELAMRDLAGTEKQLAALPTFQPIAALEAEVRRLEQDRRFTSSSRCEDATVTASRTFCVEYATAKGNLGAAIEVNRFTSKRDALAAEVNRLRAAGAGQEADPQSGIFARWVPGLSVDIVRDALALFFAVLVEFGAALGLFLATRSGFTARATDDRPVYRDVTERGTPVNPQIIDGDKPINHANDAPTDRLEKTGDAQVNQLEPVSLPPRRFVPDTRWIEARKIAT